MHIGSGRVRVLATPAMIAFMEQVAMECVEDLLPEGWTTVGTKVCIEHRAPAPLGSRVEVVARLERVEGRKLVFHVETRLGDKVIGEGVHERFIVNIERFLEKVKKMAES